jgi:hypothetical protein
LNAVAREGSLFLIICTCVSVTETKKQAATPPAFTAYNLYRKPQSHLSSRQAPDSNEPSNQSPDNQSSTAEINQQIVGTDSPPLNGAEQQTVPQFSQGGQFTAGQGFNFGPQPGQFSFGFGTPRISQNINPQPVGSIQQNFPPLNFRTGSQLSSQFNLGQIGNSLPISSAQQNIPQFVGTNVGTLPGGLTQQAQDLGQFNSFQFTSPSVGQGFAQQISYSNFAPTGLYNTANQSSILAASEGDQGTVVGFYGSVPNVGYSFNGAQLQGQTQNLIPNAGGLVGSNFGQYVNAAPPLDAGASQLGTTGAQLPNAPLQGQTQNLIPNAGGLVGSNFGQYVNGAPPLDAGASQLGSTGAQLPNAFSGFSFNPPAFQGAGAVQDTSFSRRVSDEKPPPVVGQPSLQPQQ